MAFRIKRVKVGPDAVTTEAGQVKYAPGSKEVHYVKSIRKPDYAVNGWTTDKAEALECTEADAKGIGERYAGKENVGTLSLEKINPFFDHDGEADVRPKGKPKPKPIEIREEAATKPIDDRPPPSKPDETKQHPKEADKATTSK